MIVFIIYLFSNFIVMQEGGGGGVRLTKFVGFSVVDICHLFSLLQSGT